jgi:hypothetical protein
MKALEFITLEFVIFLIAMGWYIRHIIKNEEFTPNPVTFGIWLVVDYVNLLTYLKISDHWEGPVIMACGATVIFILSLKRSAKEKIKLKNFDWFCIIASLVSLTMYFLTGNAVNSNLLIQIVLVLGFLPLIRLIYKCGNNEPLWAWGLFAIGWAIVSIKTFNHPDTYKEWVECTYPFVQGFLGCSIVWILSVRQDDYVCHKMGW